MRQQMAAEAAKLKRRSMDVERQYALYVQKKTELEEQAKVHSPPSILIKRICLALTFSGSIVIVKQQWCDKV